MNPFLGQHIPGSLGKRYVISDIHSCLNTFKSLLSQISLTEKDQLFLLGDFINKGPNPKETLDYVLSLHKKHKETYACMGNHDQMIIDYWRRNDAPLGEKLKELGSAVLVSMSTVERAPYFDWLSSLPYYFILDDFILVHAGFDFSARDPFQDIDAMLNIKGFEYDASKAQGKAIIHGHWPHDLERITSIVKSDEKVIPIDNGCVYAGMREGQGNLVCIELSNRKIFVQPNID